MAGHRPVLIGSFGEGGIDLASPAPSPEQVGHDALSYRRTILAIREAIDCDPRLVALVNTLSDGAKTLPFGKLSQNDGFIQSKPFAGGRLASLKRVILLHSALLNSLTDELYI